MRFLAHSLLVSLLTTPWVLVTLAQDYAIQTSQASYEVVIGEDSRRFLYVAIPSVFTNTSFDAVFLPGCHTTSTSLVRKQDDTWVMVYSPIHILMCNRPRKKLMPGASIDLEGEINACLPDQNCGPEFVGPIEGTFRLRLMVYTQPEEFYPAPLESRVSNPFELRLAD
ncbi:MAG: hypothetical protein SH809_12805 [Rhodothermales bacterium]|nr:hypothetical protein [Rhodothermales bacterium]